MCHVRLIEKLSVYTVNTVNTVDYCIFMPAAIDRYCVRKPFPWKLVLLDG